MGGLSIGCVVRRLLSASPVTKQAVIVRVCVLGVVLAGPVTTLHAAQDDRTDSAAPKADSEARQDEQDDADLRLAEPEFRLINLPTTLPLPRHRASFGLAHRFNGNLARGSFASHAANLFGLDQGAFVGLELRFALARSVQAALYRSTSDRALQVHGRYDALRQSGSSPVAASAVISVEGADNLTEHRAPALGVVVSRTVVADRAAVYATPIWVHNTAGHSGVDRDTVFVGLGGRVRVSPTVYVVGEVSPRISGYAPGPPEFAVGIEKRVGGHMFQVNFTNSFAMTYAQLARGGFPDTLYLGFNLARKFF